MGKSPIEERALRHKTKEEDRLTIALYRESWACSDLHSLAVCSALRAKNPRLANVFSQIEKSTKQFEETVDHLTKGGPSYAFKPDNHCRS